MTATILEIEMKGTITGTGTINGKSIDSVSVQFVGDRLVVTTDAEPAPEPLPEPMPQPDPKPPSGNWRGPTVYLDSERGQHQYMLEGSRIRTWTLVTSSNPNLSGDINISEMTNYEKVFRSMWISEIPGGPPMDGRSEVGGVSGRKISWSQKPSFMGLRLHLIPGRTYYLNISAPKETFRTGFYLTFGSKS